MSWNSRIANVFTVCATLLGLASPAGAQLDVGSDGSDGAFNPTSSVTINLALAADASWDTPSPVAGKGVYDVDQWAIVFKYSSVNIPAGVTVNFTNHPSGAPVVWLVSGSVMVSGTLTLNGSNGHGNSALRVLSTPGPGGFRGGIGAGTASGPSGGMGPGGATPSSISSSSTGSMGAGGSYATLGTNAGCTSTAVAGPTYGNGASLPLIGGSGGSGHNNASNMGGGAGGGAILIAANSSITIALGGTIRANGGDAVNGNCCGGICGGSVWGGSGSGGAVRLIADHITNQGQLQARKGAGTGRPGGNGRIRAEANSFSLVDLGDPLLVSDLPGPIFPPVGAPKLQATLLGSQTVPLDPAAIINDPFNSDVLLSSSGSVMLQIDAENVPVGTTVSVRIAAVPGVVSTVTSTPLAGTFAASTATATVTMPAGYSIVQLRASFP